MTRHLSILCHSCNDYIPGQRVNNERLSRCDLTLMSAFAAGLIIYISPTSTVIEHVLPERANRAEDKTVRSSKVQAAPESFHKVFARENFMKRFKKLKHIVTLASQCVSVFLSHACAFAMKRDRIAAQV